MTNATASLAAFRAADFDWATRLRDVWRDAPFDVPDLHARIRAAFAEKLAEMRAAAAKDDPGSPLGWVIVGPGGSGKTHLLGAMRREAAAKGSAFVLVDMTDVRDFWETLMQGYLDSLQEEYADGKYQHEFLLGQMVRRLSAKEDPGRVLATLAERKSERLSKDITQVIELLKHKFRKETMQHQDVVRALICLNSTDNTIANAGMAWLQAQAIEDDLRLGLAFQKSQESSRAIVKGLSWIMSLAGPAVVAFDQLDPIVHQVGQWNFTAPSDDEPEREKARAIVSQIGGGFGAIRDTVTNTLSIICCVEPTWHLLNELVLTTYRDRFEAPVRLPNLEKPLIAEAIIRERLAAAYSEHSCEPPYPTWPFKAEAIHSLLHATPREVLKLCEAHRKTCIEAGTVTEWRGASTDTTTQTTKVVVDAFAALDEQFDRYCREADITALLDEKLEDERLGPLFQTAFSCLLHERDTSLPSDIDRFVDVEFSGGKTTKPLHARLCLVFHSENSREEHYCVRALQRRNHAAFKTRLKAAMTQSGIDKSLRFRHLTVVRTGVVPGGAETAKLVEQFKKSGGKFYEPADDELRVLSALRRMLDERPAELEAWLQERQPVSRLNLASILAPGSLLEGAPSRPQEEPKKSTSQSEHPPTEQSRTSAETQSDAVRSTVSPSAPMSESKKGASVVREECPLGTATSKDAAFPIGRTVVGVDKLGDIVSVPLGLLSKHTIILGGSGSGKSVTVRRVVEEAALLRIPSIIIDAARDMMLFDEHWPKPQNIWQDGDAEKAKAFHEGSEMFVWTPGRETGNPLLLEPLPDFSPLADDAEELDAAVQMAAGGLTNIVAPGSSQKSQTKQGILLRSLRYFARHVSGGELQDYIGLLADLPPDAGMGVQQEARLASEMADSLRVEIEKNLLLRTGGTPLDPAVLFGDDRASGRTRISVISLLGLPSDGMQNSFVNQLAMLLFTWIKKNPHPPGGRALRGLLVIDEAKDLVPSRKTTECKESLMRLAAQARKYGLGLVFATQHPRDIETKIVGNCATHLYGLNNSPASIETLKDLMVQKGGSGNDIGRLKRGQFYIYNADAGHRAPIKIQMPMSLSVSPDNPLEESTILEKARRSRQAIPG
ncbi:MAG: DUF87 domain-containing protein [Planctomycetaceae bacterium]